MTMRAPTVDVVTTPRTFDPAKRYRYTWPGQPTAELGGEELTALCRGADADMLAIEEVAEAKRPAVKRDDGPTSYR